MYDFHTQLEKGQQAEEIALDHLKKMFSHVEDVREDPVYQEKGIDFLTYDMGIEIKSDSYNTDLLFFETKRHVERNIKGWLYTCQAELMVWVKPGQRVIQFSFPHARETILSKLDSFRTVSTKTRVGNSFYSTQGVLVPVSQIL